MSKTFKLIGYPTPRDFQMNQNGIVFTNIGELLRFLGERNHYWDFSGQEPKEVQPTEEFQVVYRGAWEGLDERIAEWRIMKLPDDTKTRIVGVDAILAFPQRKDRYVYQDYLDLLRTATDINPFSTRYDCMTIADFLKRLAGALAYEPACGHQPKRCEPLEWKEWDFVALENMHGN